MSHVILQVDHVILQVSQEKGSELELQYIVYSLIKLFILFLPLFLSALLPPSLPHLPPSLSSLFLSFLLFLSSPLPLPLYLIHAGSFQC